MVSFRQSGGHSVTDFQYGVTPRSPVEECPLRRVFFCERGNERAHENPNMTVRISAHSKTETDSCHRSKSPALVLGEAYPMQAEILNDGPQGQTFMEITTGSAI